MKILLAKDAGYCFGVRDAVNLAYETAEKEGEVYMLGHIVHNENVVEELEKAGTKVIHDLNEVPDNKPILFRAHGTVPKVWDEAGKKGINIVDATCPLVTEIHEEVRKLAAENRRIIIIGDHGHDEVNGIMEQVQGFVNTICFPTRRNHEQIKSLAELSDIMIVIGSFTSANSKRLTELAKERNERTYQVTCANDLDSDWFQQSDTVGVSAGASTPDNIIENVVTAIKFFGKVKEVELIYE